MIIKHEVTMDLARRGCDPIIHLSQGDTGSHQILCHVTKNRKTWIPPDGLSVLVHYSNAFGTGGTYDTLADDTAAWSVEEDDVCVTLVPEVMALPGSVLLTITFLCGGKSLSAFHIRLMIDPLATPNSPVLTNYSNITGFLPVPDFAAEGQFFTAETVTDSGRVASVAAVDAPASGGNIDSSMLPTATVDVTDNGAKITLSDKNGTTTATISNGQDGVTPHIGDNGNWFLGQEDTGKASQGATGPQGPKGETGAQGPRGDVGKTAYAYAQDGGYTGTEEAFAQKLASEGYGYVAQAEPPKDTNLLWLDTEDDSEDTSSGAAQADWNAPEGEPGHILNRTHYETAEEVLRETAVAFDGSGFGAFSPSFELAEGVMYEVTVNGETSACKLDTSMGMPALLGYSGGIQYAIVPGAYIYGEPRIMAFMWNADTAPDATVSVKKTIAVKIPERFLPESTVKKIIDCDLVYTEDLDGSKSTAVARDNVLVNDLINWVRNGYDVVIRVFEEKNGATNVGFYPVTGYTLDPENSQINYMVTANTSHGASQSYLIMMAGNDSLAEHLTFLYMEL